MPENYEVLLPIYKSEKAEAASLVGAETDRAVQKSVKMIKMHSITVKPERKTPKKGKNAYTLTQKEIDFYNQTEFNKWVPDAYLLIGISHYYKQDYHVAMKSLQLILNKFRNNEIKYEAMFWVARCYASLGDYRDADNYLKMITDDPLHPVKLNREIDLLYADIFIKQKEYAKALEKLDIVISATKKKKTRARLKYIQAQLNLKLENKNEALKLFAEIVKMNPPYDMAFSAKINMARAYSAGSENSESLKRTLNKMLRDDKNIEYQDQIYYALAQIEMKDGNPDKAENYYHLSIKKSVTNVNQKALSYLALADINFDKKKYLPAGEFYDSTMSFLDKKYADYDLISLKAQNLSLLTDNLKIISREDSLQKVAKMDSLKRLEYIYAIIAKIKADEIAAKNEGNTGYDIFSEGAYNTQNQDQAGKWYFYNQQTLSLGKTEFRKMWGNRILEDNWRRKNKTVMETEDEGSDSGTDSTGRVTDKKNVKFYLQDLPLNDSLLALSDEKIARAYFEAGNVYERKLNDLDQAIKSFETLTDRFPKHELALESYFSLYLIHYNKTKNRVRSEYYRNKILNEYPYSKYANILSDPNYLKKLEETSEQIAGFYEKVYNSYKTKEYQNVIKNYDEAFKISKQNDLSAKFLYLKAMSHGNLGDTTKMRFFLEELVLKYKDDEITPNAQAVLDMLKSGKHNPNYYTFDNGVHYYIVTFENNKAVSDNVKFRLSSFYLGEYPQVKFTADEVISSGGYLQIVVKEFISKEESLNFYNKILSGNVLKGVNSEYNHFVISKANYGKLQKLPIVEKYLKFFEEKYF